jgi:hypothetical protein
MALALPMAGGQFVVQPSQVAAISNQVISPSRVLAGDGTAAAPARSYTSDDDLGWYLSSGGENWVSGSSVIRFRLSSDGPIIGAGEYLQWGSSTISSPDIRMQRAAARALTLGPTTGVTLRWATDGLLEVRNFANSGVAGITAGNVTANNFLAGAASSTLQSGSTGRIRWESSTVLMAPANGQMNLYPNAETTGVGLDFATDAILKVRTRAQTGYATVDALAYQVSGVAGATGATCSAFVGGLCTAAVEPNPAHTIEALLARIEALENQLRTTPRVH